jgi:hypothetical protein
MKDNCRSFVAALLWMTGAVGVIGELWDGGVRVTGCDERQLQILRRYAPLDDRRGFWMTGAFLVLLVSPLSFD